MGGYVTSRSFFQCAVPEYMEHFTSSGSFFQCAVPKYTHGGDVSPRTNVLQLMLLLHLRPSAFLSGPTSEAVTSWMDCCMQSVGMHRTPLMDPSQCVRPQWTLAWDGPNSHTLSTVVGCPAHSVPPMTTTWTIHPIEPFCLPVLSRVVVVYIPILPFRFPAALKKL